MASKQHDFIIQMIQIKMKSLGFNIVATDSLYYKNFNRIVPPTLVNHRPDCIGFRKSDSTICIGEAKYFGDLYSKHTKQQLNDYIILSNNDKICLVIAVPLKEIDKLNKIILKKCEYNSNLIILQIPEELLPNENT